MSWILIFWIASGNDNMTTDKLAFSSKNSCEIAKQFLLKKESWQITNIYTPYYPSLSASWSIGAVCLEKE